MSINAFVMAYGVTWRRYSVLSEAFWLEKNVEKKVSIKIIVRKNIYSELKKFSL